MQETEKNRGIRGNRIYATTKPLDVLVKRVKLLVFNEIQHKQRVYKVSLYLVFPLTATDTHTHTQGFSDWLATVSEAVGVPDTKRTIDTKTTVCLDDDSQTQGLGATGAAAKTRWKSSGGGKRREKNGDRTGQIRVGKKNEERGQRRWWNKVREAREQEEEEEGMF